MRAAMLTEALLFGAQRSEVRRAKGPLSYKVEEGEKRSTEQSLYSAVWVGHLNSSLSLS